MLKKTFVTGLALGLGLSAALASAATSAAGISGKKNLICATSHVMACADEQCMQGTPKTFDLMNFFFVDFSKKVVHGVDDKGKEATSPIKNSEVTESSIILQGVDNHRGWTLGIDRKTSELNMSSTGVEVNFIITGNCIER